MPVHDPVDVVSFIIAFVAFFASQEIAILVGPYAAIIVLSAAGAALSLSGNEDEMSHWRAAWYISIRVMVAVVLTVSIAELLRNVIPWAKPRYTLVPMAFAIGWIKDYASVRAWMGGIVDKFVSRKVGPDDAR